MFPTAHRADILMRKQARNQGCICSVAAANVETEQGAWRQR